MTPVASFSLSRYPLAGTLQTRNLGFLGEDDYVEGSTFCARARGLRAAQATPSADNALVPIIEITWHCGNETAEGDLRLRGIARPRAQDAIDMRTAPAQAGYDGAEILEHVEIRPARNFWPMRVPFVQSPIKINCAPLGADAPHGWWLSDVGITTSHRNRGDGIRVGLIDVRLPDSPAFQFMQLARPPLPINPAPEDIEHAGQVAALMGATSPPFAFEGAAPAATYYFAEAGARGPGLNGAMVGHLGVDEVASAIVLLSERYGCDLICICAGDSKTALPVLRRVVRDAHTAGTLCIFSGGASDQVLWPARYDDVISVGAYGLHGAAPQDSVEHHRSLTEAQRASTSRYVLDTLPCEHELNFLAPGIAVELGLQNEVRVGNGTSYAAPIATATLAAALAQDRPYMKVKRDPNARVRAGRAREALLVLRRCLVKSGVRPHGSQRDLVRLAIP